MPLTRRPREAIINLSGLDQSGSPTTPQPPIMQSTPQAIPRPTGARRWFVQGILMAGLVHVTASLAIGQVVVGPAVDAPMRSGLAPAAGEMVLEEILNEPLELRTSEDATVFVGPDFDRRIGVIRKGTRVRLASMRGDTVRVRGRATHGDVAGWMRIDQLEAPEPEFFANLKAMYERHLLVADMIAKNQVALGMTVDEVRASLGRPTRRSSELTADGRVDTMEYAIYERVPQVQTVRGADGRLYQSTIFVQVQTGNLKISFQDDNVISIAEEEGNPVPDGGVRIVPPPIILF